MDQVPRSIAAQLVLWYRRRRGEPWHIVAANESSSELTARAASLPSGDVITLPAGEDPNRRGRLSRRSG